MIRLRELMAELESMAPLSLAESWDNVGLLLGDPNQSVQRVMTCLTLTRDVVTEAVSQKADVIIAHHPILFRGAKAIRADKPGENLVWELARAGIALISHHTAWDGAAEGANQYIAQQIGLTEIVPMKPEAPPACVKFTVFVPDENLEAVRSAVFEAGAGHIGQYDQCSFSQVGTGTFRPLTGANPTIGEVGARESVTEHRLEIISPKSHVRAVLNAIRSSHCYEEPAIDMYEMVGVNRVSQLGVGRIGELTEPVMLSELAKTAADRLQSKAAQMAVAQGLDDSVKVKRVAVACGAGDDLLDLAMTQKADVIVSGEFRFHTILKAVEAGVHVILVGHFASERPSMEAMAEMLQKKYPDQKIWASQLEPDPLRNIG